MGVTQAYPLVGETKGYGIMVNRATEGVMQFLHTYNNEVIAELARVDVSAFYTPNTTAITRGESERV